MLLVKKLVSGRIQPQHELESGDVIFFFQTVRDAISLPGTPFPAI